MTLLDIYEEAVLSGAIEEDIEQKKILKSMQSLANKFEQSQYSWFGFKRRAIKGIYLYGSVGVGKTYLVDLFYQYVKEPQKARFHFHHFMQQIDVQLRRFQGQKNPVWRIAKHMSQSIRLLCFDEFLVHDVAYAMILAELFKALEYYGITLVISSNTHPDDLYLNGVQRARFLPAIAFIKKHCDLLNLIEERDYRVGRTPLLNTYLYPLNAHTTQTMEEQFALLAKGTVDNLGHINVQHRDIPYLKCASRCIWFSFDVLCHFPRSQLDYLEIAERFDTVFISDIPKLTESHTAQTIMFIHCIDIFYDQGICVLISAAVSVEQLYESGEMQDTFQRTLSRLREMQSHDYLARHPHRVASRLIE